MLLINISMKGYTCTHRKHLFKTKERLSRKTRNKDFEQYFPLFLHVLGGNEGVEMRRPVRGTDSQMTETKENRQA